MNEYEQKLTNLIAAANLVTSGSAVDITNAIQDLIDGYEVIEKLTVVGNYSDALSCYTYLKTFLESDDFVIFFELEFEDLEMLPNNSIINMTVINQPATPSTGLYVRYRDGGLNRPNAITAQYDGVITSGSTFRVRRLKDGI